MEECSSNNGGLGGVVIKKGPWKPEEDHVLLCHVRKYGPCDWSSIRSKGLLRRTGKSCRLRWVNKLRPNLKNGCKFTVEEERTVIELQAQLGNKWATIATHLPGRTDNDVKNFWSSRQKRLARILHCSPKNNKPYNVSSSSSSSTAHKDKYLRNPLEDTQTDPSPYLQDTKISSCIMEGEPIPESSFNPSYSIPGHVSMNDFSNHEIQLPSIPNLQTDLTFPTKTQELIDRLDCGILEPFGYVYEPALLDDGLGYLPCLGGESKSQLVGNGSNDNPPTAPDSFFDDFPMDMFDQIEPLPSSSGW